MTDERKEQIRQKLTHADIWDKSKQEFHRMLYEAMAYIGELEKKLENGEK